eukprot:5153895-Amphidinium_carterae.1
MSALLMIIVIQRESYPYRILLVDTVLYEKDYKHQALQKFTSFPKKSTTVGIVWVCLALLMQANGGMSDAIGGMSWFLVASALNQLSKLLASLPVCK